MSSKADKLATLTGAKKTEDTENNKTEEVKEMVENKDIKETKEVENKVDDMNEMVTVTMIADPMLSDETRVVGVNDLVYRIPYGVPVKVEKCIALIIEDYNKRIKEMSAKRKKVLAKLERIEL